MPIHGPLFRAPLRYTDSEMTQVVFTPTQESVRRVLPKPLEPGLLGGVYIAHYRKTPMGPFWEAGVVVQCTYKEHYGIYTLFLYTDNDASLAVHREVWGYPAKLARFEWQREGNHITSRVIRNDTPIIAIEVDLEGPGEWIDVGAGINLKLIPSVDGKGYDVKQITATKLQFDIHESEAGSAKLTFGHTDQDPLSDLLELESIVAGQHFKLDLTCPYGEVIAEPEL